MVTSPISAWSSMAVGSCSVPLAVSLKAAEAFSKSYRFHLVICRE